MTGNGAFRPATASTASTEPEGRAVIEAVARLNGPAAPPEVPASLLAWLTSEENSFLTGQVIFIDGGAEALQRPELV